MVGRKEMVAGIVWQLLSSAVVTVTVCSFSISTCGAFSFSSLQLPSPRCVGPTQKFALRMSSASGDDPAISAIRSLADYHEGEWKGRARSFTVTPDVAAGIVQRKVSPEFTVAVKLSTSSTSLDPTPNGGLGTGAISLSETISWDDKISHRSIPLFTSSGVSSSSAQDQASSVGDVDVDDVDASYSLDLTQPNDFPSVLSGLSGTKGNNSKRLQFVVEHCIAAGEDRRCRCFAVYGEDESLLRVVISDETRVKTSENDTGSKNNDGKIESETNGMLTIDDIIEMESDVDRLVDKISAQMDGSSTDNTPLSQKNDEDVSVSTPTAASRLDMIGKSIEDSNTDDTQALSPYDISLLEVTNGVWLGDMIIRETPNVEALPTAGGKGKGFGKKSSSSSSTPSASTSKPTKYFAEWNAGVQKVAWRWMWNFEEEIRQIVDAGKALGSSMDDFLKKSLAGNVCVDESFSRRKPKAERMVYIDWGQDSVGFLLGPFSVRLPRYVNFDPAATTKRAAAVAKPFFTEFGIFQDGGSVQDDPNTDEGLDSTNICCSKIGRLYNYEGRLKQGCTSFYTFKRFADDGEDDDDDDIGVNGHK